MYLSYVKKCRRRQYKTRRRTPKKKKITTPIRLLSVSSTMIILSLYSQGSTIVLVAHVIIAKD